MLSVRSCNFYTYMYVEGTCDVISGRRSRMRPSPCSVDAFAGVQKLVGDLVVKQCATVSRGKKTSAFDSIHTGRTCSLLCAYDCTCMYTYIHLKMMHTFVTQNMVQ